MPIKVLWRNVEKVFRHFSSLSLRPELFLILMARMINLGRSSQRVKCGGWEAASNFYRNRVTAV